MRCFTRTLAVAAIAITTRADAQTAQSAQQVVDIPTRRGVTQRMIVISPPEPKAAVVLIAGGDGGLQLASDGSMKWGKGNFLIRSRQLFVDRGLMVAIVDAPSDHQSPPFLDRFRQTPGHVADLKAVTILTDKLTRPVPAMPLSRIRVPVLVVHHEQDGCMHCSFSDTPSLMKKLVNAPRTQLIAITGGESAGDPCEAFAHHGFNGVEAGVVRQIAEWILAK